MKRDTKIVAALFAAIPVLILSGATICTWAIAHGASMQWRLAFRLFCHGIAARCFYLWNVPMPICARCVAIYAGLFLGLVSFVMWPYAKEQVMKAVLLGAVVPLAIDGLTQLVHLRQSTNELRFGTGIVAGFALGMWALSAIQNSERSVLKLS